MKTSSTPKRSSLDMRSIFRCMMEEGYCPTYERTHIQFNINDNIAVLEYNGDILCIRLFFDIEEDAYDLFLEASNQTMLDTYGVKSVILDDMKSIMFSCETVCAGIREFRKYLPFAVEQLSDALEVHKEEMRKLILASGIASAAIPATEETAAGTVHKIYS